LVQTLSIKKQPAAFDNLSTSAQLFVSTVSQVTYVFGIKTNKQFVNTLEDDSCILGVPTKYK